MMLASMQKAPTQEAPTKEYPYVSQLNPEFAARNNRLLTAYDGCLHQAVAKRQMMIFTLPRSKYPNITNDTLLTKAREYEERLAGPYDLKPDSTLKNSSRQEIASHDILLILAHQEAVCPLTLADAYKELGQNIMMDTISISNQAILTYFQNGFQPIK